ncbi:MAG: TatD family hydrolase [Paracoccaceae bacterium]
MDLGSLTCRCRALRPFQSQEIRDIFAAPLERVLVETDAPYLAPPPFRGKRNEPAYTAHTARRGAEVFGLSYADFAAATSANFDRLFQGQ